MSFRKEFTKMKAQILTTEDISCQWGIDGKGLRCGICGYKFKSGDLCRWQYMKTHINIFVCKNCDDTTENLREKIRAIIDEFKSDKFWLARKYYAQ